MNSHAYACLLVFGIYVSIAGRLRGISNLGRGYDILEANPHGQSFDPGFKISHVLNLKYGSKPNPAPESPDIDLPLDVIIQRRPGCIQQWSSSTIMGARDWQKSSQTSVGGGIGAFGARFTASASWQKNSFEHQKACKHCYRYFL
jgi:hypothetical protein